MGGHEAVEWLGALEASFEAGLAREEDAAADDLAFSLRQDVDVRDAIARSGTAWSLLRPDGETAVVDEVGGDYLRAGDLFVPSRRAAARSVGGPAPASSRHLLTELLGQACRAHAQVAVTHCSITVAGVLARVGRDHVAVRTRGGETMIGLDGVEAVRLPGYSASRGFSG